LALCNFVAYDLLNKGAAGEEGEEEPGGKTKSCVVALDIGADSSNLIITDADRIIWQRPIPLGGNHFTRALTKDLKLTFAKAEHLKRNATKSPDLKKILAALKPVLNDFVGEVQRSLGYFTNTHRDAHVEYMVGLGNAFRLPGLQRFLAEKLQLDVRKLGKLERLQGEILNSPTYTDNILSFAVAYGLAVQGTKHSRLVTNLLPGEIRIERMVRAKKPWAVTAAACLLITSAAMALDVYLEYRAYGDKQVLDAEEKSKGVIAKLGQADAAYQQAVDQANAEERAVRAIVAGQAEQKNWLNMVKFLSGIAPQPDGEHFPPKTFKQYWDEIDRDYSKKGGNTGKHAFTEYKKRLEGLAASITESGENVNDDLSRGIDDLILCNVESVDCRYAGDLAATWANIRKTMPEPDKTFVRPEAHWDAAPSGPGWVFEVKGYTYHHRRGLFVVDALVENIARLGSPDAADAKGDGKTDPKAADGKAVDPKAGDAKAAPAPAKPAEPAKPADPKAAAAKPAAALAPLPKDMKALEALCKEPPKISHVVLYRTQTTPVTGYGAGTGMLASVLDNVIVGGGAAAAAGPGGAAKGGATFGGGAGAVTVGGGGGWSSLLGAVASNPTAGFGFGQQQAAQGPQQRRIGGTGAGNVIARRRAGAEGEDEGAAAPAGPDPATLLPTTPTAPVQVTIAEGQHARTDFVVLFFWQEPTPSDQLRQLGGKK
jgi:hypothetical protein